MGDTKERYYRVKQECTEYLGGKCVKCGTTDNLEFDHIDPSSKLFEIISGSRLSVRRRHEELSKCQLLCRRCHAIKTASEKAAQRKLVHGTKTGYNRGCRCSICTEGQRIRMAVYLYNKRTRA